MADQSEAVGQPVVYAATLVKQSDPRLTDARPPLAHTHTLSEIVGTGGGSVTLDYGTID